MDKNKVRLPKEIADALERVREKYSPITEVLDVTIGAGLFGEGALLDFTLDHEHRVAMAMAFGYDVMGELECICIDEEAGVRAYEAAEKEAGPLEKYQNTWHEESGISFEEHAAPWFEAAQRFRAEDPLAGTADPDCPWCGGSGKAEDSVLAVEKDRPT